MQFVPLPNFYKILKLATTRTALTFTDISNTSRTLYNPCSYASTSLTTFLNFSPFFANKDANYTAASESKLFVKAASETTPNDYVPANIVGSCTCSVTENSGSNGWTMTIKVAGNEGDEINTLYFTRKLWRGGNASQYEEAVLFAVKLDETVTLGATGIANFTFAIEF